MAQLLRGVKVVELAVLLTGDYAGMLVADEGAGVVKVENTQVGDYQGTLAPGYSPVITGAIFSADGGATAR